MVPWKTWVSENWFWPNLKIFEAWVSKVSFSGDFCTLESQIWIWKMLGLRVSYLCFFLPVWSPGVKFLEFMSTAYQTEQVLQINTKKKIRHNKANNLEKTTLNHHFFELNWCAKRSGFLKRWQRMCHNPINDVFTKALPRKKGSLMD